MLCKKEAKSFLTQFRFCSELRMSLLEDSSFQNFFSVLTQFNTCIHLLYIYNNLYRASPLLWCIFFNICSSVPNWMIHESSKIKSVKLRDTVTEPVNLNKHHRDLLRPPQHYSFNIIEVILLHSMTAFTKCAQHSCWCGPCSLSLVIVLAPSWMCVVRRGCLLTLVGVT